MRSTRISVIVVLALGLMVCSAGVGQAAPMGTVFTYQGRLIDSNSTADGPYDFQFKLYDAASDGNEIGSAIDVNECDVIDGYFTVALDYGGGIFDGNDRWLEIAVRPGEQNDPNVYTTLSPRQEITPTPYALYAASGPGVEVPLILSGSDSGPIISGTNSGSGYGVYGRHSAGSGTAAGVHGVSDSTSSNAVGVVGEISSASPNSYSAGVRGVNNGTSTLGIGVWGSQAGGGWGVYGTSVDGIGVYGHGTSGQNVENYGGYFQALGSSGRGVYGKATGAVGRGVHGYASNSGYYTNYGGYFEAAGQGGSGVYGWASNNGNVTNYGGRFEAAGNKGRGVYGHASNGGDEINYRGYFTAWGTTGRGVYGRALHSGSYTNFGGQFQADGLYGIAVYGFASNTEAGGKYGGYFVAAGYGGLGVQGQADDGTGVRGFAGGSTGIGVSGDGGQYDFYADGPGTNYGSASSIRWKSDVRAIDEPLGKVARLRGVYFNWDAEHGGRYDVGMIAEEVGKVLPEIVDYEENGIDAVGMDYSKLTPLLVEAIKELKAENDALKQRIEKLEETLQQSQLTFVKEARQ